MRASSVEVARGVRDQWVHKMTGRNLIWSCVFDPVALAVNWLSPNLTVSWIAVGLIWGNLVVTVVVLRPGPLRTRWARRNQRPELTDRADRAERLHRAMPVDHEAGRYDLGRAAKLRARNLEKALNDLTAAGRITSRVTTTGRRVYRRAETQQDRAS